MKTKAKRTARQEHWLSHLERARALKMPLAQYCRAQGLNVQSLYNARHELSGKAVRTMVSGQARKSSASASPFIAVQMPGAALGLSCRIQLRDVVIECSRLPEAAWLLALSRGAGDAVS